jgi:hypothetical protein
VNLVKLVVDSVVKPVVDLVVKYKVVLLKWVVVKLLQLQKQVVVKHKPVVVKLLLQLQKQVAVVNLNSNNKKILLNEGFTF